MRATSRPFATRSGTRPTDAGPRVHTSLVRRTLLTQPTLRACLSSSEGRRAPPVAVPDAGSAPARIVDNRPKPRSAGGSLLHHRDPGEEPGCGHERGVGHMRRRWLTLLVALGLGATLGGAPVSAQDESVLRVARLADHV